MKAGCEGFVGTHQLEVGDREERALCSGQRDQHVQKLRWERTKFMCSSARFRVCWGWKSVINHSLNTSLSDPSSLSDVKKT